MHKTILEFLSITIILLPFWTLFLLLLRVAIAMGFKKKAKEQIPEIYNLINASKYEYCNLLSISRNSNAFSVQLVGNYKGRKVKCIYFYGKILFKNTGGHIYFEMKPLLVKSKLPYYKFIFFYPKIYKNYMYDGYKVYLEDSVDISKEKISKERAIEILDELVEACKVAEDQNFNINEKQ